MKERPILFSGPMVQAIVEERKTQTRRVVKFPLGEPHGQGLVAAYPARLDGWIFWGPHDSPDLAEFTKRQYDHGIVCPYGVPGDRLWVRETWAWTDSLKRAVAYRADGDKVLDWRPSIHMRREYSRLTLEVCEVRVQRVQEITQAEMQAEGITLPEGIAAACGCITCWRNEWIRLWDSINKSRGFGWDNNPWVWVISFRRVTP